MSVIRELKRSGVIRSQVSLVAMLGCLTIAAAALAIDEDDLQSAKSKLAKAQSLRGTHLPSGQIKISGVRPDHQLQTFCLNKDGLIFGVVAPPRPYAAQLKGDNNSAEIRVHDADGKELRKWNVDFAVQSIAAAPNGSILVAGNGMIAKFSAEGSLLKSAELPHIAQLLKDSAKLKEEAKAQLEEDQEQYDEYLKPFRQQTTQVNEQLQQQQKQLEELTARLEKMPEKEWTTADKSKLLAIKTSVRNLESQIARNLQNQKNDPQLQNYKQRSERSVDEVVAAMTRRLRIVNAIAVSDQDVFIASGVLKGFGYSIWRTGQDFKGAEQIVTGLSGCCGQMDIRCCEDRVFVAENSRKRVLQYDRDGKKLSQWGEGDRDGSAGANFGGCCNPMNLCFSTAGEVLTAESEGVVKRFTKEGSYLGIVGIANLTGGCKNVAIGLSPNGEKAYFYDREGSRIVILSRKTADSKPKTAAAAKKSRTAVSD